MLCCLLGQPALRYLVLPVCYDAKFITGSDAQLLVEAWVRRRLAADPADGLRSVYLKRR